LFLAKVLPEPVADDARHGRLEVGGLTGTLEAALLSKSRFSAMVTGRRSWWAALFGSGEARRIAIDASGRGPTACRLAEPGMVEVTGERITQLASSLPKAGAPSTGSRGSALNA
jgi:hypothetical protein